MREVNPGDHIMFRNKQRVHWNWATVLQVSKHNPNVFHVTEHNPMLVMDGAEKRTWLTSATVHRKRIEQVIPASQVCSCGHPQCATREEYKRRVKLLREATMDELEAAWYYLSGVMGCETEEALQAELSRIKSIVQRVLDRERSRTVVISLGWVR